MNSWRGATTGGSRPSKSAGINVVKAKIDFWHWLDDTHCHTPLMNHRPSYKGTH